MVGLGGLRVCEVGMFCWINLGGVEVAASV